MTGYLHTGNGISSRLWMSSRGRLIGGIRGRGSTGTGPPRRRREPLPRLGAGVVPGHGGADHVDVGGRGRGLVDDAPVEDDQDPV